MKKYSVIITNAACGNMESFDTLDEALDEIKRQHIMDEEIDKEGLERELHKLKYAIRDNASDEIVWAE